MCLIVLAHQLNTDYPLIMATNRDEFRQRPTQSMHWWPDIEILAGKDLEAFGTWLALHKDGRWAVVTNSRRGANYNTTAFKSRGYLAIDFLQQKKSALAFTGILQKNQFAGFNFLLWDNQQLVFCSNEKASQPQVLAPGLYGLSNGCLNSSWPKVEHVKTILQGSLNQQPQHRQLQKMMQDTSITEDQNLPNTGIAIAWERRLSACFIDAPEYAYGTRTRISLYRDHLGQMDVQETSFDGLKPTAQYFSWQI